jgi:two-component system, chemotaxis family, chemotaxis protein CheY
VNILLVDDSRTMRNIQKKTLEPLGGIEFSEAADGVEALAVIATGTRFDLIVVDWNMPNMDGLMLIGKIREADKRTPIIMCTTEAEKQRVIDAIKAGATNYLVKPFTPEAILEKVRQTLARAKAA